MEKYIEAIIEIVLEHITCLHQIQEEYPRGPKQADVTYGLVNEQEVIEKCLKVLPGKPGITDEFIEKKAIKLHKEVYGSLMKCDFKCHMMIKFREQIRMIFEEES